MDDELGEVCRFVKVWVTATASASYCYALSRSRSRSRHNLRFFLVAPVICLFCILPYNLTSCQLGGMTFFYLVGLANFKLLLFSFNLGPLSNPFLTFSQFVCICLLPIKVKHSDRKPTHPNNKSIAAVDPSKGTELNGTTTATDPVDHRRRRSRSVSIAIFGVKMAVLGAVMKLYEYTGNLPTPVLLAMYCCQVYLSAETYLAATAAFAKVVLGLA